MYNPLNKTVKKAISVLVAGLFLVNNTAMAGDLGMPGRDKLSPVSGLSPITSVKHTDGKTVVDDPSSDPMDILKSLREDSQFVYLSILIGRVMERFGDTIDAEGLKAVIRTDLPDGLDVSRFRISEIYAENGSFCIPYIRVRSQPMVFRFYLPESLFAGGPGEVKIDFGGDSVLVRCEKLTARIPDDQGIVRVLPKSETTADAAIRRLLTNAGDRAIILPVCQANIVRSPQIEFCLKKLIKARGLEKDIAVISAGVGVGKVFGIRFSAQTYLEKAGDVFGAEDEKIIDGFFNKPLTPELLEAADIVIVAEEGFRAQFFRENFYVPGIYSKTITWRELRSALGMPASDMPDKIDLPGTFEVLASNFDRIALDAMKNRRERNARKKTRKETERNVEIAEKRLEEDFGGAAGKVKEFLGAGEMGTLEHYDSQPYTIFRDRGYDRVVRFHAAEVGGEHITFYSKTIEASGPAELALNEKTFKREAEISDIAGRAGVSSEAVFVKKGDLPILLQREADGVPMTTADEKGVEALGRALGKLHAAGVVHRDLVIYDLKTGKTRLKSEHIYKKTMGDMTEVSFIDFGMSETRMMVLPHQFIGKTRLEYAEVMLGLYGLWGDSRQADRLENIFEKAYEEERSSANVETPAVMFRKVRDPEGERWDTYVPVNGKELHKVINAAWAGIWDDGWELPENDEIVTDVEYAIGDLSGELEIHVHSPPGNVFYDRLYPLAERYRIETGERLLPSRNEFRLVTHPGTWRSPKGKPRSLNLLIPAEEMDFIRWLKWYDQRAYREWLAHEAAHLTDRAQSEQGYISGEEDLSQFYPIEKFMRSYNTYRGIRPSGSGSALIDGAIRQLSAGIPEEDEGSIGDMDEADLLEEFAYSPTLRARTLIVEKAGKVLRAQEVIPEAGINSAAGRLLFLLGASAERGTFTYLGREDTEIWSGRFREHFDIGQDAGQEIEGPYAEGEARDIFLEDFVRSQAIRELSAYHRVMSAKYLKRSYSLIFDQKQQRELSFLFNTLKDVFLDILDPGMEAYAKGASVRRAAAEALEELLETRDIYLRAMAAIEKPERAGTDSALSAFEEDTGLTLSTLGRLVLGLSPPEKDLYVRRAVLSIMSARARTGSFDPGVLIESLFDVSGTMEGRHAGLREAVDAYVAEIIMKNGDENSIAALGVIAAKKDSDLGRTVRSSLLSNGYPDPADSLMVKSSPDGSPHAIFELLRQKGPADARELREHTKGRDPEGHLTAGTIRRDLGTLVFLGLVDIEGRGSDATYIASDISPSLMNEIRPVLISLGSRPSFEEKKAAKERIDRIFSSSQDGTEALVQGVTAAHVKEIILDVKKDCGDWGACNIHAPELLRRLAKAGISGKVMKMDEPRYWVEAGGYVIDAFPEGMGEEYVQKAAELGDERFIIAKAGSDALGGLYRGYDDEELTEKAISLKDDDGSFYAAKAEFASRIMRERVMSLVADGNEADVEKDKEYLRWKKAAESAINALERAFLANRTKNYYMAARGLPDGSPHSVFSMLNSDFSGRWVAAEDIRLMTSGMAEDGHLSIGTVLRDLGILEQLGLVKRRMERSGVLYRAREITEEDIRDEIDLVLRELGDRPGAAEKEAAGLKVRTLLGGSKAGPERAGMVDMPLDIVPREEIKNILVYGLQKKLSGTEPKLGEMVIDMWPLVTGLYQKYPQARIWVASPYPEIFSAKQFGGRVIEAPLAMFLSHEKKMGFLVENSIDLVAEVSPAPGDMKPDHLKISELGGRIPYYCGFKAASSLTGATEPAMLRKPEPAAFLDREGNSYDVAGMDGVLEEVAYKDNDARSLRSGYGETWNLKEAGSWNLSMGKCRTLGLEVDADNLTSIELGLEESVAALEWLEDLYYAGGPEETKNVPFDPTKKIVVVNVYAVTQQDLISEDEWVEVIVKLMENVQNAYFIFTHGGIMDANFNYVDEIASKVQARMRFRGAGFRMAGGRENTSQVILPRVRKIYPYINNVLGIASAAVTLDTGFSHLASGVYNVPTAVITHSGILQWMPPRKNVTAVVMPSAMDMFRLYELLDSVPEFAKAALDGPLSRDGKIKKLSREFEAFAEVVNTSSERHSAAMAKAAALSSRKRSELDAELIDRSRPMGPVIRDNLEFVRTCLKAIGMADLRLLPAVAVVDSAEQMGIDEPRFIFKLHKEAGGDSVLMVDKTAFRVSDGTSILKRRIELLHEVVGHKLARLMFPEFVEAAVEAAAADDSEDILITKTIEEVLAWLVTFRAVGVIVRDAANIIKEEELKRIGMPGYAPDAPTPVQIQLVMDEMLMKNQELSAFRYRVPIRDFGEKIKRAIEDIYLPAVDNLFYKALGDTAGERMLEEGAIILPDNGERISIKALSVGNTHRMLQAYDGKERRVGMVFAQYDQPSGLQLVSADEMPSGQEPTLGIKGVMVHKDYRTRGLQEALIEAIAKKFSNLNVIHPSVKNPIIIMTAQEKLGFIPVDPMEENTLYVAKEPGPEGMTEIWLPLPEKKVLWKLNPRSIGAMGLKEAGGRPEDLSGFVKVYANTRYRKIGGDFPRKKDPERTPVEPTKYWAFEDDSADMIVSRAAVNFYTRLDGRELYSASYYAEHYRSHTTEDYDLTFGLKGNNRVAGRIEKWQKEHPGETFRIIDMGTGRAAFLASLGKEKGIDAKKLSAFGVNNIAEKEDWDKLTGPALEACSGYAEAGIKYFDFFEGWMGRETDREILPEGYPMTSQRIFHFISEMVRVLKPGGIAHIHVGTLYDHDVELIRRIIENGAKPGLISYGKGVLHIKLLEPAKRVSGRDPAISLIKKGNKWEAYFIDNDQHILINAVWKQIWNEGYEIPDDDVIAGDLRKALPRGIEKLPIHIHSPPGTVFYDRLYELAENLRIFLPARKDFRLVTHPGTFRGNEGARSFNLLIPLEDLDLLKNLRKEDPAAYSRWLEHEVGHLVDRAASKKGTEKDEEEIVSENPITELVAAYNHDPLMSGSTGIKVRKTETPASRFREVIKGLYDPDPYVRAASARDISGLIRDRVSYPKNDQALRRAIPRLIECLYDNETFVVQEAMNALAGLVGQYRLTEEEEGTLIAGVLGSDRMSVRIMKDLARMVGPSAMTSAGFRNNILFLLMESMSVEADPELQEESMEILAEFDYFVPGARTENLRVALLVLQTILIKGECPEVSGYYGPQIRKSTQGFASYGIRARRKAALALTKLLRRVAAHSGRVALFSGADGTVIYRSLIEIYSGIFSAEMALIHPSSEYRDQNRVIREAASFGVSGITKATFDILMEVSTAAGIMPMRQRIEIAALTTKLMREVSGHIAGILGGIGPIADSPVVKRELMRALAEVVIPGFNAHDTILPRIFDLEEAPLADGGIVELTVKTITRSGDEKALAVLRSLALKSDSELARIIGDSLLQYDVMEEENVYGRDGPSPVGLIVPGPRYHISDIEKRIEDATRQFCLPYEKDESTILSPEKIGWEKINALLSQKGLRTFPEGRRPVLHLIDVNTSEGEPLFGFPIMEEASEFIDTVPVVSYVSSEDGLIHVFMTRTFYDDYIDIVHVYSSIGTRALRVMRLAEILDHEDYENSAEVRALPPDERHHNAALRAREFIPKRRKISSFHKWVIDTLALTPRGIDHITLLLDEQRPQPEDPDQRSYEEEFYSYARGVIPRKKFSKKTQKAAHHIMRAYRYGDRRAFGDICFSLGISPKSLDEKIQVSENEHIKNVIGSFRPEVTVTGTSETDVDIDSAKKIVRKRPKGENTDAKTVVDSYLKSRERLGGLIADLSVIDGTIYQEKVTPLTVYLQHLVAGTGPFERLGDKSYDNKLEIGKDVLRRYMECIIEFAKRGALISNLKVTNFGVRENGEVVLIDLGPSTVIWADDDKGYVSLGKDMILIKSGWDIRRLRDLNSGANAEETGSIVDLSGVPRERELQAALADHWQELITGRKVEAHEEYLFEGGEELLARVEEAFPENISDAAREWRMMTFIPTAAAEDEILELIMQEVETAGASSVPDGSPYFIYRILSGRFSGHAADTDEIRVETRGRAPDGHLSEDTVLRDLNTLVYLGLVEKKVTKGPGKRVSEWKAVMPETEVSEEVLDILISMGPRPTAHEKRKALSEIKEKLGKNDIASLQGIRFVPSNIGNARKTLTAFDRNGEEIGFVYAQQDEGLVSGEEARLGLRGIYIRPKDRHAGVGRALLGEFFREYPGINTIHRTVMNPVLIYTAQKHLGFEPVEPKAENIAYIYISRHPDVRSRIWIPNGDLRFDHRFGPEEAMTGELDVLDEAPGDMAEFIPIYLATVYERPAPAPGAEDMMKEAPRGPPSLEEIYGSGKNISGGVADLDRQYFGNITSELTKKISEERAGPVKILIIGQGRGFEAFELMREHKEEVEVFVASREDLLYLRGEELSARFDEDGLRVTPGEAEHLIKDLRGRFYKYDVEAGIPISAGAFDMVVIDAVSMGNVMDKMRVINEMTRVTREGGTVYCAPHSGFVDVGDGVKTLPEYIYERKINGVKDLDGEKGPWMKIVKTAGADLPGLDARRVLPISISSPNGQEERVGWKTVYEPREAVRSGRATPNASPQEYRKWLELSFPEDGSGSRINPVTIRDVQDVKTISRRISHTGLNTWTIERIASGEEESMRDIYVLEDHDGIKGYIYFSLSENADTMIIEEIAVAKSEEGKGTASRLLAKAMTEALDLGVILFEARIKATEKRSSALFSRFGFMPEMPSPPGNAVHYKLELSGKRTGVKPVPAWRGEKKGSGIRMSEFFGDLPLTADKIKRIPFLAEKVDIPSGVRALQEGMARGMKSGGFLPRIGEITIPECCDPFECVVYSHGRIKIPLFRVDRHLTEKGKITDTNGEEYVFSVMDENGEHIGHGIIYMLDMSGTALFRFSIHVPRDPSAAGSKKGYRGRGYGSETLAAITAIAAKGGLFSVPVDELVFSHRAQDALSGIDINGMSAMVRLLDKAGFSKALSFDMKEAFQTSEELFLWERSRGLDLVLPERYNSKKYSDVTRDVQEFLMDEGIPDPYLSDIQDAIAELSLNIMEHGKGGVVRLNGMDGGEEGIRTIRVTAADMGPGLGASPDALLARGRQRDGREAHGYGLENILLLPGRVTIEYSGDRWEKVSPEVAGKRFTRTAASDITEGTLFDLEFDVKTGQHEEDELSRYFPLTQENDAPDWRRDKARAFLNEIMIKALKEETVIIGVDTSWVPAVQEADVQALLSELSRIYKKKGMNNIVIRRIKGDGLAGELKEDIEKTGASLSNVVLLGDVKVLSSREFDYLRGTPEEGAFFASVDIPKEFPENSYLAVLEMIASALRLASGADLNAADEGIEAVSTGPRSFRFIPKVRPMDLGELKAVYLAQRQFITSV